MPDVHGNAKVESQKGRISIDASFPKLASPQQFGNEYLTYVLWAITPEGRAQNLGEIVPGDAKKLSVTTDLQAFGMIVTAEPYFSVTQPSDVVVIENTVRPDTVGASEYIDARYELVGRHQYIPQQSRYAPTVLDPKIPLYLHEARNAVRIAEAEGATVYASDSFNKAATLLQQAEDYQARKKPETKPIATVAREAAQMAEDARLVTIRRRGETVAEQERQAAAKREADARAQADQSKSQAEDEAQRRQRAEADAAESARLKAQAEARQQEAQAASEAANREKAEAQAAQQAALQQQQAAQAETEKARLAAAEADQQRLKAEQDREQMRAKLLQQLNTILETKDTARGLIVNISDVLFDTGKYTLKPGAREKLAKVAGIVLSYPDLRLQMEGHTDNIGSDQYNQTLSERRAEAVRSYLTAQGVPAANLTAIGLGKTQPVASNATSAGRQQNRRVEMVVSGEAIGTKFGAPQRPGDEQPSLPNNPPKQ
jgi:outer membrane protein OmpA-like peptidoglycan-associated protein